jgi:hypothetical protein
VLPGEFVPDVKRGWCQKASVHTRGFAARSCRSQFACADEAAQLTFAQLELSAIRCQAPMSKL